MSSAFERMQGQFEGLSARKTRLLQLLLRGDEAEPRIEPQPRTAGDQPVLAPATAAQRRLWFIDRLEGQSSAYHIPLGVRLRGSLDCRLLQRALDAVVRRHETLRTTLTEIDGEVFQRIAADGVFTLDQVDLRDIAESARAAEVLRQAHDCVTASFDLETGPLARARLLRLADEEHLLLITMHHTICDGWSLDLLVREIAARFGKYAAGDQYDLPPLPLQYADYARWQNERLHAGALGEQVAYWQQNLRGAADLLALPADRPRLPQQSHRGASAELRIGGELAAGLRALARRYGLTLTMTLYAAWAILLARLSGQADIVIGMPVAARRRVELEPIIGLFVNTLAVRLSVEVDSSATEILKRAKLALLGAYANQDAPFEQVVEALQPARTLSHSPIFQVMLAPRGSICEPTRAGGVLFTVEDVPLHAAQFDLTLFVREAEDGILASAVYATDLFDASTVERWMDCFRVLLGGLLRDPERRVSELPWLSDGERTRVVAEFNATAAAFDSEALIHELFERQVRATPHAVAVVCDGRSLTYAQLNERANQLACYLRARGIGPDRLVGICLERSLEMTIGLLGVLKAGGAYVPLDPTYPPDRLAFMLKDSAPGVLLTQACCVDRLPVHVGAVVNLDGEAAMIASQPSSDLDRLSTGLTSRNLAYVIYTSGSTGRPKGAMNEHGALVNRLQWMQRQYVMGPADRVLQKTPFSFDVSVWEFFWTLSTGACLVMARPEGHKDPAYLRAAIEENAVTTLHFVPSMLQAFLGSHVRSRCPSLTHVICSGEELSSSLSTRCLELLPQARLSNLYGPTEAAVDVTYWECSAASLDSRVPIGRPVANTQIYVLDGRLNPVPVGVAGEIHIGGVQVGRGYLNRSELTAEKFIPDPFSSRRQARLYKTGDLGRWRCDGAVEYLGRLDHQVKIRGFRIELGEIEAQLLSHPQLADAVVVAREDVPGDKRLVAYFVPKVLSERPSSESLGTHLRAALPEHMIPGVFVALDAMPLSPNGKLQRQALPVPDLGAYRQAEYDPPQNTTEEMLARVWQDLLRLPQVGRGDNFFALGGHSLLLVRMLDRLRDLGFAAGVREAFESPTLADLARRLTSAASGDLEVPANLIPAGCLRITPDMLPLVRLTQEEIERIVQAVPGGAANVQDIYPLAPLQEGILFHSLFDAGRRDSYVVPVLLQVASRARVEQLIGAMQKVVNRHDALRTAVMWERLPQAVQVVYRHVDLPATAAVLDPDRPRDEQLAGWLEADRYPLDLRRAPLLDLQFAADPHSDSYYVLLRIHHIIGDNASREILTSEVVAFLDGDPRPLQSPLPYRIHVAQTLAYARTHDAAAFFRSKLADADEPTASFGLLNVHGNGENLKEVDAQLDADLSQSVRRQARRMGVSAATLFHSCWALVIAQTSGRDDVIFGTVLLGRLQSNAGVQQIFGMFINTLPLRIELRDLDAAGLVARMQRELAELLIHEQASLSLAIRCSGVDGSAPLFTSLLNYRHRNAENPTQWSDAAGVRAIATRAHTNYPIALSVDDSDDSFALRIQTEERIDPRRILGYIITSMRAMLTALEQGSTAPALSLAVLPEEERRQVVELFNATSAAYPHRQSVSELFEEQAERTPNAVAVLHEDQVVTYAELNARANRLARYLRIRGVASGEHVPIHMERSLHMLIAQIAVLKCGAVYLPLDPQLPVERRCFIIEDCGAQRVICRGPVPTAAELARVSWIDCADDEVAVQDGSNLHVDIDRDTPAYVMYTSGSTGVPKGVVVPHRGITRLVINNGFATFLPTDCVAHYSTPSFDASTLEVWGALLNGARLLIVPQALVLDAEQFADVLDQHDVTVVYMSVGLFNQYTEAASRVFPKLRYLMIGGEAPDPAAVCRVLNNSPPRNFLNVYGPTECTTLSTTHAMNAAVASAGAIPIGRPLANSRAYVLDSQRNPVPIGVTGELYLGGDGVACGYLNRPQLTAERFLPDPFTAAAGGRMYRTGDLARWRADGVLEFLGRNDFQVKLRGYRIEPGEIETRLSQHPAIREAVVVARQDAPGDKRLVAYFVARGDCEAPHAEQLRAHLRSSLPEYMIPSAFVQLDVMPLSATGKVNRRALPAPRLDAFASSDFEPVQGPVEQTVADVYRHLLHLERVGRNDDFFALGGHSLLALQALVRINDQLGSELRIADLYRNPAVQQLARRIDTGGSSEQLIDLAREAILDADLLPARQPRCAPAEAVLLTGATGFVGRFMLDELLRSTRATIHCLVRASSPAEARRRLHEVLVKWNLWRREYESRVVAIPGDLRQPRLGLDARDHAWLSEEVGEIFHCATSMNHLETYAMARAANVGSAHELLRLAVNRRTKLINYMSTLGVFSYDVAPDAGRLVHETTLTDSERHSAAHGYAASKWVAEKIFMRAAERGIPCNVFRLGLVWADAAEGRYDELQQVDRFLRSCLLCGHGIEKFSHEMPPTPVDGVVRAVAHLAGRNPQGGAVFHVAAGEQATQGWFERCNELLGTGLKLLPEYEWIQYVKGMHDAGRSLPVVPLIEYAFTLDRAELAAQRERRARLRFDCSRTHRELAAAGLALPPLDDGLLQTCIAGLQRRLRQGTSR